MTLKEKAGHLPSDQLIYVGAKCNFFWVGKLSDMSAGLSEIDKDLTRRIKRYIQKEYDALAHSIEHNRPERYCKPHRVRAAKLEDELEKYVPVIDREIMGMYKRIGGGLVVLTESEEQGLYWDYGKIVNYQTAVMYGREWNGEEQ